MISITDHIRSEDSGDIALALNRATRVSAVDGSSIHFPAGTWTLFTYPNPINTMLVGEGGPNASRKGTILLVKFSEINPIKPCFLWDGSGENFRGEGGGAQNMIIAKADGCMGGCAVAVIPANNTTNRSGYTVFRDVMISSQGTGLWSRGFLADGSRVPKEGVRDLQFSNFHVSACTDITVEFVNAISVKWTDGNVMTGSTHTTVRAMLRMSGVDLQQVSLSGVSVQGDLVIAGGKDLKFVNLHTSTITAYGATNTHFAACCNANIMTFKACRRFSVTGDTYSLLIDVACKQYRVDCCIADRTDDRGIPK